MSKIAVTKIPGRPDIELPAFYEKFQWYYPNCELRTKEWFVKNARPDWVYVDCGANIGYYSILFSQLSPQGKVHAVEPTSTADMLEKNLAHNRCNNVTVHRLAMGQHPGRRVEKIFRIWGGAPEELAYDFTTVDQLVEQSDFQKLDCLKIDVDSFDFEVLKGAEKTLVRFDPWIVIELSNALALRKSSAGEVLSWLQDRGYKTARVVDKENYIFKRTKSANHRNEMSLDLILWLIERDILPDVVGKLHDVSLNIPWANNSFAVDCLVSSAQSTELVAEFQQWSLPSQVYPQWQCFQYAAFARAFAPDCVLQFGRWSGEFTFSLMTGMNCATSSSRSRLWSFCKSILWNRGPEYQKLVTCLGSLWLSRANFIAGLPTNSELAEIVSTAKRILVFWNDPSPEAGDIVLGGVMPLIQNKDHAVIIHGISDGRFGTTPSYEGDAAGMMILGDIGDIWSRRIDLPRIIDFIVRNNLQLLSPERAFKNKIDTQRQLVGELQNSIGPLFSTSAGWHWFTLNGHAMPMFFPQQ